MANSKSDKQLERMMYLMEYNNKSAQPKQTGIEYHVDANDGKTYGIIRENNMYYIKTTTPDKATLKESYEYINGFDYRKENGYKSYNEATKHLELKLMAINESLGKHEDVSVFDSNKGKKAMQVLTEAARIELDRMNQIFENSNKIGIVDNIGNVSCDKEHGTSTGAETVKNNKPFEEKAEATLDKDPKTTGTVKGATPDNKEIKQTDEEYASDKMKTANTDAEKNKDAHDDLEGEGVADQHPKGAKAVKMNESLEDIQFEDFEDEPMQGEIHDDPDFQMADLQGEDDLVGQGGAEAELGTDELEPEIGANNTNDSVFGDEEAQLGDDEDLDSLLEEFMSEIGDSTDPDSEAPVQTIDEEEGAHVEGAGEKEDKIVGPDQVMDGPHGTDGKDAEWQRVDEDKTQEAKQGDEEFMKSYDKAGTLPADTMKKMNEAIDRITEAVCDKLAGKKQEKPVEKKKETLEEAITRIVKEEVTRLDAWGKHPRYQKAPFQTPANKEVMAGSADKDWNDDSAKGEQPYGKQIGSSAPYDKKVDMITDAVVQMIKEGRLDLKKK